VIAETSVRARTNQILKDAGRAIIHGRSVHCGNPLNHACKADDTWFDRRGCALANLEAKNTGANRNASEVQRLHYTSRLGGREQHR
jgi:hypothetical protein